MEEIPEEMKFSKTRWFSMQPFNGTLKDSLRIALEYTLNISEADLFNIANDPSWFHYEYDDNQNAVVKVKLVRPYTVIINRPLTRQYDWNVFLLITLHEWFHIYIAFTMNNDETHETTIAENYILWMQKTFNCSAQAAKHLAYVGTENNTSYDTLAESEKVDVVRIKYHIKNRQI